MANDCLNLRPPKPITEEFAELFGTDRRVGNTVSLDTRNGTVDVGSDGRLKLEAVESVSDLTDAPHRAPVGAGADAIVQGMVRQALGG